YLGDPFFSIPIALAVLVGSLGFPVILVVARRWRSPRHWSMHAKLTLVTTAALLVCAWIGYLLIEGSNPATLGGQGAGGKVLAAGFTAVMPRSGGFSTLDVGQMRDRKSTRLNSSHVSISYA